MLGRKFFLYCPPTWSNSLRFWWPPSSWWKLKQNWLFFADASNLNDGSIDEQQPNGQRNDGKEFMRFLWVSAPDTIIIVWWIYLTEFAIIRKFSPFYRVEIIFDCLMNLNSMWFYCVPNTCWNRKKLLRQRKSSSFFSCKLLLLK